jgi:hypothetical protein
MRTYDTKTEKKTINTIDTVNLKETHAEEAAAGSLAKFARTASIT